MVVPISPAGPAVLVVQGGWDAGPDSELRLLLAAFLSTPGCPPSTAQRAVMQGAIVLQLSRREASWVTHMVASASSEEPNAPLCQERHHIASHINLKWWLRHTLLGWLSGAQTVSHFSYLISSHIRGGSSASLEHFDAGEVSVHKMNVGEAALRIFL